MTELQDQIVDRVGRPADEIFFETLADGHVVLSMRWTDELVCTLDEDAENIEAIAVEPGPGSNFVMLEMLRQRAEARGVDVSGLERIERTTSHVSGDAERTTADVYGVERGELVRVMHVDSVEVTERARPGWFKLVSLFRIDGELNRDQMYEKLVERLADTLFDFVRPVSNRP